MLLTLIVLINKVNISECSYQKCCDNNSIWNKTINQCSDGKKIKLFCANDKIQLDQIENTDVKIINDSYWLAVNDKKENLVPENRYDISKFLNLSQIIV